MLLKHQGKRNFESGLTSGRLPAQAATTAIRSLNGRSVNGREIRLDDATSLAKRRKEKKATEAFERREAKRQAAADAAAAAGGSADT